MSDKLMNTQELGEIRRMIGDLSEEGEQNATPTRKAPPAAPSARAEVPVSSGEFDLDQIIAEVSGVVDSTKAEHAAKTASIKPAQMRPSKRQKPEPVKEESVSQNTVSLKKAAQPEAVPQDTAQLKKTAQPKTVSQDTAQLKKAAQSKTVLQDTAQLKKAAQPKTVSQNTAQLKKTAQPKTVSQDTAQLKKTAQPKMAQQDTAQLKKAAQSKAVPQDTASLKKTAQSKKTVSQNTASIKRTEAQQLQKTQSIPFVPEEWEDQSADPEPSRREKRKLAKQKRRERERMEDARADEIVIKDPRQAQKRCAKRAKSLAMRSIFVLILGILAVYITIAPGMGLPLPEAVNYAQNTRITVLVLMLLQFASMFAGLDTVGMGFYSLCTGHPDRSSLISCAMVASLVHGLCIILFGDKWGAWQPYCAVSIVLLYAGMIEEKNRLSGRYRAYKAAQLSDRPMGVYAVRDAEDHVRRTMKSRVGNVTEFLREVERPDFTERFAQVYTPIALAASVIFALISSIGRGEPSRFFWALSAILSLAAPLGLLCSFGLPYRNVSRRLLGEGAALAGARQAYRLRGAREAVLTDSDLFPPGSITIEETRVFDGYNTNKVLAYAAAVTSGMSLEIGHVFADALHENYGSPVRAREIQYYESGGFSAYIGNDSVLVGTSAFLIKLGLRLCDVSGIENAVFVVINAQIAGTFSLVYHPTAQSYGALHLLRRLKLHPVLAVQDFNLSPAMVESLFELNRGTVDEVAANRAEAMTEPSYTEKEPVCAILSKDGIVPYARVHAAADKLAGAVRSNLILGAFAGICGMLLMFYLTFQNAVEAVEPKNVLLYLLLWYLPVFVISRHTGRSS